MGYQEDHDLLDRCLRRTNRIYCARRCFRSCRGGDNGPGFGWGNADIFKFGAQWEPGDKWALRAGYSYTDQPIQDTEVLLNILAPAVIEHHFTAGVEYRINDSHTIQLGGMFAPESDQTGRNPFDPAQKIELRMYQYEVTLGYAWRF